MRLVLFTFAVAAGLCAAAKPAQAAVIYANDFQVNANGFDLTSRTLQANDGTGGINTPGTTNSTFLGRFGNDTATLSLSGLTVGASYTVAFDLYIGASWDGNDTGAGPDRWSLKTTGTNAPTLIDTTFGNLRPADGAIATFNQNYSDTNLTGSGTFAPRTGADVVHETADGDYLNRYSIYYFGHGAGNPTLTFQATSSNVTLKFAVLD